MPKQTPCDTHEIEPMKNDKCDELDASLAEELRGSLLFGYIPVVPLAFLGLGIYRAWIEIAFVGTFVPFPFDMATPRDLFDSITVLTVVLCAIFANKIKTLVGRRSALTMTGILLTTSTVLSFSAFYAPNIATELGTVSGIVGGVGIAFMIVIWSEIYGSLNPFRVAAYYSLSIVAGALVIYVYEGFKFEWLFVMTALLPLVSLLCAHSALLHIPKSDRPARREATEFSIPWKAVFLMAAYAFAYGLLEMRSYSGGFGPHSSPGTLFAALAIFLGVCIRGKHFDFGLIYRGALPITVAAFLLLPAFNPFSESVSSFCISAGYTMQSILIMIIIASICYRYGASPIWLFGIERGVRQIFMLLGRDTSQALGSIGVAPANIEVVTSTLAVISIVAATMIFMSEKELSSNWGAVPVTPETQSSLPAEPRSKTPAEKKHELAMRVATVAREYKLSTREEEVSCCSGSAKPWESLSASCSSRTAQRRPMFATFIRSSTYIHAKNCSTCSASKQSTNKTSNPRLRYEKKMLRSISRAEHFRLLRLIGQNVCLYGTCVPYCQSSQNGNGSLRWSSSQTALSPHSGLPSSCFRDAE